MKREQFIDYLLHPEELKGESAVALNSLLKEFPYFQSAQLLYLKTLHNEKSIHYQSQLKIAAAYSANRKALYFLINGEPKKKESKIQEELIIPLKETEVLETLEVQAAVQKEVPVEPAPAPVELLNVSVKELEESTKEVEQISPTQELIEIPSVEVKSESIHIQEIVAAEITDIKEEPVAAIPTQETETKPFDALDSGILAEAINAGVELELEALDIKPIQPRQEQIKEEIQVQEEESKSISTQSAQNELHSFIEWLKLSQEQKVAQVANQAPEKKPIAPEKKALIEKFITTEPRIVAKKQEFYNPVNKARQSVMENDFIVSETLAKVYLKQGNFQRALKSYEILSLKFPEKSAYFASQILKIKEQQQERK